jgi:hypothetical protein
MTAPDSSPDHAGTRPAGRHLGFVAFADQPSSSGRAGTAHWHSPPAMALGIAKHVWSIGELLDAADVVESISWALRGKRVKLAAA